VGDIAWHDQDQAITANAEATVSDADGQVGGVCGNVLVEARHVDVVVARAVHFGEADQFESKG
jgi:hypothetical protein